MGGALYGVRFSSLVRRVRSKGIGIPTVALSMCLAAPGISSADRLTLRCIGLSYSYDTRFQAEGMCVFHEIRNVTLDSEYGVKSALMESPRGSARGVFDVDRGIFILRLVHSPSPCGGVGGVEEGRISGMRGSYTSDCVLVDKGEQVRFPIFRGECDLVMPSN